MRKHRLARQDVAATRGVGQVLQRFGQPHTDRTAAGDGNREISERFVRGTVGGDPPPRRIPPVPPPIDAQASLVEVMTRPSEPFTTLGHMHPMRGASLLHPREFSAQML
jgi:hypothetical protein